MQIQVPETQQILIVPIKIETQVDFDSSHMPTLTLHHSKDTIKD